MGSFLKMLPQTCTLVCIVKIAAWYHEFNQRSESKSLGILS